MRELKTGQYELRPLHEFTVTKTEKKKEELVLEPVHDAFEVMVVRDLMDFSMRDDFL